MRVRCFTSSLAVEVCGECNGFCVFYNAGRVFRHEMRWLRNVFFGPKKLRKLVFSMTEKCLYNAFSMRL